MATDTQLLPELFMPTADGFSDLWKSAVKTLSEEGVIDFVSKLSPWIAPLPSAWFVHDATARHLNSGSPLAWIIAIVIETLGLTTTHTALGMHTWNKLHQDEPEKQAPFALAVILAAVYVLATLSLISVLEVAPGLQHYAPAMFPILAVVGAVNLALRSHHNGRIRAENEEIAADKNRRIEIEDENRAQRLEERRMKAAAKYGIIVNQPVSQIVSTPVKFIENGTVNLDTDTFSEKMTAAKLSKVDMRRATILDAYNADPTIKIVRLMELVGASRNTVKGDMRALGIMQKEDE